MKKHFLRACSWFLTVVMLLNLLPMSIFAEEFQEAITAIEQTVTAAETEDVKDAYVVDEIPEKRSAYSKEFLLSNGVHMAAVFAEPVHYATEDGWAEIDNTLTARADGTISNTAGVWDVRFPQQLTRDEAITIEKDGYTLSFFMAGELTEDPAIDIPALPMEPMEEVAVAAPEAVPEAEALCVAQVQQSAAVIQTPEVTEEENTIAQAQAVPEKNRSRLLYGDVYEATDLVYDLRSNRVKESVILAHYRSDLRGYRYTLNVGQLQPVLQEDGGIWFYDEAGENVVMSMPAPYLVDSNDAYNYDIQVALTGENGVYTLTYQLPQGWLAAEERAWPVILDPVINADLDINNILDRTVTEKKTYAHTWGMNSCGYDTDTGIQRFYLMYENLPVLTSSDVILEADIVMCKYGNSPTSATVEVRKVNGTWNSEYITWANKPGYSSNIEDYAVVKNERFYGWVITDIVRDWYTYDNTGMMFKVSDDVENAKTPNLKQFLSSDYGTNEFRPTLSIYFRNNNGLESYWDYSSASAGRAGTGSVNNLTGNLTFVRSDIGFGGNRMPVSISHVYNLNDVSDPDPSGKNNNANDTAGNFLGLGVGWRTNFHQELYRWTLGGEAQDYYIWEDADGTDHYFYQTGSHTYEDEDGLELTLTNNGSGNTTYALKDKQGNVSYFDSGCRLYKQENNQQTKSSITVTYCSNTSGAYNYYWISTVTDGIGRTYHFNYTNNLLSSIECKSTNGVTIGTVTYTYNSGKQLTKITDKDGKSSTYTYDEGGHLLTATDIDGYRLTYTYHPAAQSWQPWRIKTVTESAGNTVGGSLTFTYAHNQTTIKDHSGNVQTLQFNDYGNLTAIQDDEGHAQHAQFAKNKQTDTGKGNQLTAASKLQNTVGGLLSDGSFERALYWTANNSAVQIGFSNEEAYHGSRSLKLTSTATARKGAYSHGFTVGAGETVTFSAYVKGSGTYCVALQYRRPTDSGLTNIYGTLANATSGWERKEVTVTNPYSQAITFWAFLLAEELDANDPATVLYMDQAQVELCAAASRYNLIDNGDFVYSGNPAYNWTSSALASGDGIITVTEANRAAPTLDNHVFSVKGNPTGEKHISQTLSVSGSKDDCYVFTGWAWADAAVAQRDLSAELLAQWNDTDPPESTRKFDIQLTAHYTSGETETGEAVALFNPGSNTWQYTAGVFVAKEDYDRLTLTVRYDYNANTVWFDGFQLYKEQFGASYTYDEKGNVISVTDLQKQTTTYEYDDNDNVTAVLQDNKAKMTYKYDDYHNVTEAKTEEGLTYTFAYDEFGNNTSVSIGEESGKITAKSTYSPDGNTLVSTADAAGNTTTYGYDAQTNLLEWVQSPEDTASSWTEYNYDSMNRVIKTTAIMEGSDPFVEYTYEDDRLATIHTVGGTYRFAYNDFGMRTSVSIKDHGDLVSYTYTNDGNNYLSGMEYGNGDLVSYDYDDKGRLLTETYTDGTTENSEGTVEYVYDNDGNLSKVIDSASGITACYYYDLTDRLMKYTESGPGHSLTLRYTYDTKGNLTYLAETCNGEWRGIYYSYDDDNRVTRMYKGNGARAYTYDSLGRVTQKRTEHSATTRITEDFAFVTNGTALTTQVESHTITTGVGTANSTATTYHYSYDKNGNITEISKGEGSSKTIIATYAYDTQNRLKREDNPVEEYTYTWTYDRIGNIMSRTEYPYTPADEAITDEPTATCTYGYNTVGWEDLLESYTVTENGETKTEIVMEYDDAGNPEKYGQWEMDWVHGRQLAQMTDGTTTWSFTYNADGLRTKRTRTENGATSTWQYAYSGSQLVKMVAPSEDGNQNLAFAYDAEGTPLTVRWGNSYYYYVTNLQGDVIAITDSSGNIVVTYTYDAWGKILSTTPAEGVANAATLANLNPLRYRGYVYDTETGLYLTGTRYYDPEIGRFVNADSVISGTGESVQGYNLFAYCFNNPVNMSDPSGNWPKWATKLVAAVAVVAVVAAVAAVTVATAGAGTAIAAVAVGAAKGAAIGFAVGAASGAAIGYATTGTLEGTLNGMADGALSGSISGAITGGVNGYSNYSSAANFLKSNGANPKEVLSSYKGTPKVQTLKTDTTVYRTWGGTTQELGHWVSPNNYGSSARNLLSLPIGNTMTNTSSFLLPKGTTVLAGKAAPLFGQSGGGVQWWISVLE